MAEYCTVVTGASGGIGGAVVERLAAGGRSLQSAATKTRLRDVSARRPAFLRLHAIFRRLERRTFSLWR